MKRRDTFSRLASLDPAATEILFALGAGEKVVAVSHDSDYPEEVRTRTVVSFSKLGNLEDSREIDDRVKEFVNRHETLYQVDSDLLSKLDIDLVVTQDLCGLCAVSSSDVEEAISRMSRRPEVYSMKPPNRLEDILELVNSIGVLIKAEAEASKLVNKLKNRIAYVRKLAENAASTPNVACVEWLDPLEISPSWVPEMLEYCHAKLKPTRSEIMSSLNPWRDLIDSNPDVLIVSPCSFKIQQTQREMNKLSHKVSWRSISAVQKKRAYFIDSDYYNRAGLRLVDGLEITATIVQPDLFEGILDVPNGAAEEIM